MPDLDEMALVKEYATTGSEKAFAMIVKRYVNLVYSVALRMGEKDRSAILLRFFEQKSFGQVYS